MGDMPIAVSRGLWAGLALAASGALYLYAVRGGAIMLDLAAVMCW